MSVFVAEILHVLVLLSLGFASLSSVAGERASNIVNAHHVKVGYAIGVAMGLCFVLNLLQEVTSLLNFAIGYLDTLSKILIVAWFVMLGIGFGAPGLRVSITLSINILALITSTYRYNIAVNFSEVINIKVLWALSRNSVILSYIELPSCGASSHGYISIFFDYSTELVRG